MAEWGSLRLSGLWARGRAGPRALECFCRPVRGKPGRLGTGELAGGGAAQTIRGIECTEAARSWCGPWLGAGFLLSCPRAAAPAFKGVLSHFSKPFRHWRQCLGFGCICAFGSFPNGCTHAVVYLAFSVSAISLSLKNILVLLVCFCSSHDFLPTVLPWVSGLNRGLSEFWVFCNYSFSPGEEAFVRPWSAVSS